MTPMEFLAPLSWVFVVGLLVLGAVSAFVLLYDLVAGLRAQYRFSRRERDRRRRRGLE